MRPIRPSSILVVGAALGAALLASAASAQFANGSYKVVNKNSGKCVDAANAGTANGTAVQQYTCNGTSAQTWVLTATDSGFYKVATANAANQVWDVSGASTADGGVVHIWTYGSGANQQWKPVAETGGYYHWVARHDSKCLDVPNASTAEGTHLQQWTCNGTAAQAYQILAAGAATPTSTATATATATATPTPTTRATATATSRATATATSRATATATTRATATPTATTRPTATATAGTSTVQIENCTLSGGAVVATDHTGYTGSGFVGGFVDANKGNAAASCAVSATAHAYTVALRYANASGVNQTLSLYVNGTRQEQITLATTANWDTWATQTSTTNLNSGTNTILYKYDTTDTGNVNLDKVDVASFTPTATPTPAPTPAPGGYGATVPFTTYEMEDGSKVATTGSVLAASRTWGQLASEASGRSAVRLTSSGQYVQFNLAGSANAMVVRYSIPDTSNGAAYNAGLSLYVGGVKKSDITLTNKYNWLYGTWSTEGGQIHWSNNPAASPQNPHRFYDEVAVKLDASYAAGTQIKLMRETTNANFSSTASVTVDLVETETIPGAVAMPSNYTSITSNGGVANDGGDDTTAMNNAINAVKNSGGTIKGVWIPEGTFDFNNGTVGAGYDGSGTRIYLDAGVSVRGAGMWRSVLQGKFAGLFARAGSVTISDLKISAFDVIRDDQNGVSAVEGVLTSSTVSNVWMEHTKVGLWSTNQTSGLTMTGCRVRNVWADGVNFARGTSNSTASQNHLRNTGDDGMAMWSETFNDVNNKFQSNTVLIPTLANGIAIYGGQNNTVTNNMVADIIDNGSGISFGTNFNPPSITGTLNISNNYLLRTGSWHHDYAYGVGAIWALWVGSSGKIASPSITIGSNVVNDSSYPGILIEEPGAGATQTFSSNTITNVGTYGVQIKSTATGAATFNSNAVNGAAPSGKFINQSTAFTVSGSGNNW